MFLRTSVSKLANYFRLHTNLELVVSKGKLTNSKQSGQPSYRVTDTTDQRPESKLLIKEFRPKEAS